MSATPPRYQLYLAILGHQVIGALAFPITKIGLRDVPPFTFAFFRFVIASSLMLALLPVFSDKTAIPRADKIKIAALGVLIVIFNQVMYIAGQNYTSAAHGSLLFAFTPIFVYVLSIFALKERFTAARAIGVVMAVVGAAVIVSQRGMQFNREMLVGDGIITVAVIAWAVYTVLGKPLVVKYGAFRVTALAAISGTIAYFPYGLYSALQTDLAAISLQGWLAVIYMGSALSVVAYALWYWSIKRFDVSRVAPFHNIQPIIATVVSYYLIGEIITGQFVVGGLIALGGVLVVELAALRARPARTAPEVEAAGEVIRKSGM